VRTAALSSRFDGGRGRGGSGNAAFAEASETDQNMFGEGADTRLLYRSAGNNANCSYGQDIAVFIVSGMLLEGLKLILRIQTNSLIS
jgi:hypothetical protein